MAVKDAVAGMTKGKGWEILEAYIVNVIQTDAMMNMQAFENNVMSEKPDPHIVLRQTFRAGLIRGCHLVLNFPTFVENHFKLNKKIEEMSDG